MAGTEQGVKLGDYDDGNVKVYTVRLGEGCMEGCVQCGAYFEGFDRDDYLISEVTRERIRACLEREFIHAPSRARGRDVPERPEDDCEEVRMKIADLLANYVTTDVNQEPLNGDSFIHFAELVKELTGGRSRAVCISHGLRAKKATSGDRVWVEPINKKAATRLDRLAQIMDDRDVFVLSLDLSRSQARIDEDLNLWSYAETLNRLRPALRKGARITVSIQGSDERESRLYRVVAENLYGRVKKVLKTHYAWEWEDIMNLYMDTGRAGVFHGRARGLPGVNPKGQCSVIPDNPLVMHTLEKSSANMAFVDAVSGRIFVHPHNPLRSYNDVSRLSRWLTARGRLEAKRGAWEEVHVDEEIDDLSAEFTRETRRALLQKRKTPGVNAGDRAEMAEAS